MSSVLREPPGASASAEPSARATPSRGSSDSSTARVELLVAERDWEPPRQRFAHDQIVELRVAFADVAVRGLVKQAGGAWNPERRVLTCLAIFGPAEA